MWAVCRFYPNISNISTWCINCIKTIFFSLTTSIEIDPLNYVLVQPNLWCSCFSFIALEENCFSPFSIMKFGILFGDSEPIMGFMILCFNKKVQLNNEITHLPFCEKKGRLHSGSLSVVLITLKGLWCFWVSCSSAQLATTTIKLYLNKRKSWKKWRSSWEENDTH